MEDQLEIKSISKTIDNQPILSDISFTLQKGTKLSVLGPSGSGKTTLLRIIAGLEYPESGTILFNNISLNDCPPHKRKFGMMFQDFALFPHLNVFDNIAFGLKMKGLDKNEISSRVSQMLSLTGLSGFEKRSIDELSGGESQRVALARTLAPKPSLLMLDEPLSSLDAGLRKHLLNELTNIISTLKITTIFVTHDHKEAFSAGNIIMLMNQGKIEQMGTEEDFNHRPKNDWVKEFFN